jgi:hypothetical protein
MKTFFAMVMGFLLFLATSLVLAHPHGNAVLPAVADSTTLFAVDFVSGIESRNAAVGMVSDNTTLFSATVEPNHVQIVPVASNAGSDAQIMEMRKFMD